MAEIGPEFLLIGGRRLSQLKVDELKQELEKRGLKKSGNKPVLIERLSEFLLKELYESPQPEKTQPPVEQPAHFQAQGQHPAVSYQNQQQAAPPQYQQIQATHQPTQQQTFFQQQGHQQPGNIFDNPPFHPQSPNQPQIFQQQALHHLPQQQPQQLQSPSNHNAQPMTTQAAAFFQQVPEQQQSPQQHHQLPPFGQMPFQQDQHNPLFNQFLQHNNQQQQLFHPEPDVSSPVMTSQAQHLHPGHNKTLPMQEDPAIATQPVQPKPQEVDSSSAGSSVQTSNDSSPAPQEDDKSSSATEEYKSEPSSAQPSANQSPEPEEEKEEASPVPSKDEEETSPMPAKGEGTPEKREIEEESPEEEKGEAAEKAAVHAQSPVEEDAPTMPRKGEVETPVAATFDGQDEVAAKEGDVAKEETLSLEEGEVNSPSEPPKKDEVVFKVETEEMDQSLVGEVKPPQPKKTRAPIITKTRKVSIPSASPQPSTTTEPGARKRRWGSSSSKKKTSVPISTESLKELIPDVQVHSTPAFEALMDFGKEDLDYDPETKDQEEEAGLNKENKSNNLDEDQEQPTAKEVESPEVTTPRRKRERVVKVEESKRKIKLNRQESEVKVLEEGKGDESMEIAQAPDVKVPVIPSQSPVRVDHSPSPARNPESTNIHVQNLVRPFTLRQLKELLGKSGTLEEDGFWIDRIKSHCYVVYTTVEGAVATRAALHGVKWPPTSPKILSVDFADDKQMLHDTAGALGKQPIDQDVKMEALREEQPVAEVKEEKMVEEEDDKNPANLLDSLFRKTKATPCLYWLPLTTEQAEARFREKEERRIQRQAELAKEEEEKKEKEQEREKERERLREQREKEREETRMRARDRSGDRARSPPRGRARSKSPVSRRRASPSRSRSRSRNFRRR
ncbi:apoptotic chromatin condensation inducer in the nucleus [Nematostella vectensis]|uniref:apoptotic chromatin condensation inducer in the nucleus n=1 Tax=Nematostella vectensis TaxID=45351 RepID=UPI0020776F63|nr:apoptotic chromatin condensation inducer in the nucleus [Nematostella vectensis]